jgi:hypothetical protein
MSNLGQFLFAAFCFPGIPILLAICGYFWTTRASPLAKLAIKLLKEDPAGWEDDPYESTKIIFHKVSDVKIVSGFCFTEINGFRTSERVAKKIKNAWEQRKVILALQQCKEAKEREKEARLAAVLADKPLAPPMRRVKESTF